MRAFLRGMVKDQEFDSEILDVGFVCPFVRGSSAFRMRRAALAFVALKLTPYNLPYITVQDEDHIVFSVWLFQNLVSQGT